MILAQDWPKSRPSKLLVRSPFKSIKGEKNYGLIKTCGHGNLYAVRDCAIIIWRGVGGGGVENGQNTVQN